MGNSPADLAAAAGHSTQMLLDTYVKPTGIEDAELADKLKLKTKKDVMSQAIKVGALGLDARRK